MSGIALADHLPWKCVDLQNGSREGRRRRDPRVRGRDDRAGQDSHRLLGGRLHAGQRDVQLLNLRRGDHDIVRGRPGRAVSESKDQGAQLDRLTYVAEFRSRKGIMKHLWTS